MQLKLSTLLAIIAIIFIYNYYFLMPVEQKPLHSAPTFAPQQTPQLPPQPPRVDTGFTILDVPMPRVEGFTVTPINDLYDGDHNDTNPYSYNNIPHDIAGNVRPDNLKTPSF